MNTKDRAKISDAALRKMTDEVLRKNPNPKSVLNAADQQKLVHALQVHQTELEMQNDELRAAHMELALSRDQYAELYDFAPVGYITLNATATIVEANGGAIVMLGLSRASINTGRLKFSRFVARESQDDWFRFSRTMFASEEKQRCELALRGAGRATLEVMLESAAVRSATGNLDRCMVALIDITERKTMEAEVETYRRGLEELVEKRTGELTAANAQLEAELAERTRMEKEIEVLARFPGENPNPVLRISKQGIVLYANEASRPLLKMWDCKSGEAVPDPWRKMTAETFADQAQRIEDIECGKRTYSFALVPVFDAGYVNFYGRDITERRRAEEKLAFQSHLLENVHDAAIGLDADFFINYWNESAERMYGWTAQEAIGRKSVDLFKTVAVSSTLEEMTARIRSSGQKSFEVIHHTKDGRELFVEVHSSAITDQNGKATEFISVCRDLTERRRAEEALRTSEERYRHLVKHAPAGIFEVDFPTGRFTEVNDVMCHILGYTPEELLAMKAFDVLDGEGKARFALRISKALSGDRPEEAVEYRVRTKDGRLLWALLNTSFRQKDGKFVGATVVAHDITERKSAEAALLQSAARLARAQEIAHLGSWELDLVSNTLTWSDEVYRIFGLTPQEFGATYEAFLAAVHPDDRAAVDAAYSGSLRDGKDTYEIEHRVVQKSGGKIRIVHEKCEHFRDGSGRIVRSMGMVHDITERKQAEEAVRRSKEELQAVFDGVSETLMLIDINGNVLAANKIAEHRLGQGKPGFVGKNLYDLVPVQYQEARRNQIAEMVRTGKPVTFRDTLRETTLDLTFYPVFDERGTVVQFVSFAIDITDRVRAEDALREAESRFRLALKNAPVTVAAQDRDLRFTWAYNQRTIDPAAVIGKTDANLFSADDAKRLMALKRKVMETGQELSERRWVLSNGRQVFLDIFIEPLRNDKGETAGVGVATVDLTPMKLAEEALEVARNAATADKKRLEAVIEALPVGLAILDSVGGKIRSNNEFEKIWGGPQPDTKSIGDYGAYKAWWVGTGKPVLPEEWAAAQAIRTGKPVTGQEVRIERFDGQSAYMLNSAAPVFDAEGHLAGCAVAIQDITERKKAEEKILLTTKELRETNNDLARFNRAAVDRELRMIEMKKEINDLCQKLGEPVRYELVYVKGQ